MTLNETTTKSNMLNQTEIANQVKDGSILLSVDGDRICRLNGVGALIWIVLEEGRDGLTITDVVERLSKRFESINREGHLRYEAAEERLQRDTEKFLRKLEEKKWLQTKYTDGVELFRIAESVTGTTSALTEARSNASMAAGMGASHASRPASETVIPNTDKPNEEEIKPFGRETVTAFIGLIMFDSLLKLTNFSKLLKTVEKWPIANRRTTDFKLIKRIRAAVEQAQAYYPKKVACLQNAAVMTCLLRRRGMPAVMVIGAQEFPPKAHSWVEVEGRVVNDRPNLQTEYRELRRL